VTEYDDGKLFLGGEETAAERQAKLSYVKKVRGDRLSPDALRLAVAANRGRQEFVVGGDAGKRFGLIANINICRPGETIAALLAIVRGVKRDQCGRIADGRATSA